MYLLMKVSKMDNVPDKTYKIQEEAAETTTMQNVGFQKIIDKE